MKFTLQQIRDMAGELQAGLNIYINLDTGETRVIYNFEQAAGDTELWDEELERIEKSWKHFIKLEGMESGTAVRVMENFCRIVDDEKLRIELEDALARRIPFANFNYLVERSGYREEWFAYRDERYIEYVTGLLESHGFEVEKQAP